MNAKKFLIMALCGAMFLPVTIEAKTQERELTEFCAMYALRFTEFSEKNNLDLKFSPTSFFPYSFDEEIYFSLSNIDIVVNVQDFGMDEVCVQLAGSTVGEDKNVELMASLVAMVSVLEYSYIEDQLSGVLGSPVDKAYNLVTDTILSVYSDLDVNTLMKSNGKLFPLYEGNYSYYARYISSNDTWWLEIVAMPHN